MSRPGYNEKAQRGEKVAATITINKADDMPLAGRRRMAAWLRSCAKFFERKDRKFSRRIRFRYIYS